MTDNVNDNYISIHSKQLSGDDLLNCIKGMPALLFRIEIAKNKIEYLNDYQIDGLGSNTFLLLKNKTLSKEMILEDDYAYYQSFIKATQQAKASKIIIRLKTSNGEIRWIKLKGSPNSYNPGFYLGVMMDITSSVELVNNIVKEESEKLAMINILDNPVVIVNLETKEIISNNNAAHELFGYSINEFSKLKLNDLYHKGYAREMNKVLENVIFDKKWEGKVFFRRKSKDRFLCNTCMRTFRIKNKILLSVSIYSVEVSSSEQNTAEQNYLSENYSATENKYIQDLLKKVSSVSEIKNILDLFIKNPLPGLKAFDGIIYSDIQVNKDKVIVYSSGTGITNPPFGELFTYEGSIAENIEQYKLNYLIVEDTMASIKAIDWALFIPAGIRSYYAKPFFERNTLRSILILCSHKTDTFTDSYIDQYDLLSKPFSKGLKNWRKLQRTKK
jgi:hypothetical protein